MQEQVNDFLEKIALAERGLSTPEDQDEDTVYLFYPLPYVAHTWLEHRNRGTYPESGGYNDQDSQLMEDWHMFDMRYLHIAGKIDASKTDKSLYPETAGDWTDLI